jgi:hypothetical protein
MKRLLVLALFACACASGAYAQAVDTTVCAVLKSPKSFDGKIVRIKGTVVAGFDYFLVKDSSPCGYQIDGIWLSYPQGTKGKAGPVALVQIQPAHNFAGAYTAPTRTPVTLDKSKDFKQFDNLLSQAHNKGAAMCLGCARYTVTATLVGRLDTVADAGLQRDRAGKITGFGGFGNMNAYPARLVLQSVADVTPKEVDFSKSDEITKGDAPVFAVGGGDLYDPVAAAQKSAASLAGSPAGVQATKNIAVFPKPGEHNGVSIIYGSTTETEAKEDALGTKDSPDGILFNCIFNLNRLAGDAQARAIMHMGQHISDMRTPIAGNEEPPLFILEYNAWSMTAAAAIGTGQKFLVLPGGYLLWNSAWPMADRTNSMDEALKNFLANEAALSR